MSFIELREAGDPTLVMLHGTGGDEGQMFAFGRRLSSTAGIVAPRGKEPEGRVNRWFRRFAEGVFDEENLRFRTHELADHLEGSLPNVRRIAVGFSNGANIAAAMLLLRPETLQAAVLLAPMIPLIPALQPNLTGIPVLMVCGERDPIVPRSNAEGLAGMLRDAGAELAVHWHSGGHELGPSQVDAVRRWLDAQGEMSQ